MYYLAFFIDYHPLFQDKLKSLLKNHKTYTCISIDEKEHNITDINNLFKPCYEYYGQPFYIHHEQNWYIHGRSLKKINISDFPGLLETIVGQFSKISLEKIDIIFDWFANNYDWSILPWANAPRFESFVFVSAEQKLRDRFIECSSNRWKLPTKEGLCNLLISSYNVSGNFSDIVKAILFEENIDTVGEIWEACNCDIYPPYFLTNIDSKQDIILNQYLQKHKIIQKLDIPQDCGSWNVYEMQTEAKLFFELISSELISKLERYLSSDRAFWVSQNTDFNKLTSLLTHTENEESNYSDLIYLQSFLSATEWLYTFRRDFYMSDEHDLSFFISRNSQIIKEIDIFRQEKIVNLGDLYLLGLHSYYDLLGCF